MKIQGKILTGTDPVLELKFNFFGRHKIFFRLEYCPFSDWYRADPKYFLPEMSGKNSVIVKLFFGRKKLCKFVNRYIAKIHPASKY